MTPPLRIGFIGAGANTRTRHLPGFKEIPGVVLAAVCNRTEESSRKVAQAFGVPVVAPDWRAIIDSPTIDAVCIGTWPNLHAELTIAALRAGKHVLTEARMARDLGEALLMFAEAQRHPQLVAQIVPAPMSLAFDATIVKLINAGVLGSLREVSVMCTNNTQVDSALPSGWRQDPQLSGKNTLALGIYYEMTLRWLGRGVTSLSADAAIFTPQRKNAQGERQTMTIPERVTVLGRYADAARFLAHFSSVELTAPRNEIRLHGSRAGLRLDFITNQLWLAEAAGPEQLVEIMAAPGDAWRVEADFIASIREDRPVTLTDFATGVSYMRFTEAVWTSWNEQGRWVTI